MRWFVVLAALTLFAQDSDEVIARHASAASAAMQAGDYAAAERHNLAILKLRPQMAEADMNLGLCYFLQKKYSDAARAFETGLKLKPDMANAKLFLGISRFNLNEVSAALAPLREYTKLRPDDVQGQYYLGVSYLALDKFAEAERALQAAQRIDPRNIDVLYHLAQSYLGQARNDPSRRDVLARSFEDTVSQIAAIDPESFRIAQLRAGFYEADGKRSEAIEELQRILEHDPRASGLHYTLGCIYTESRQYGKALEQFEAEMHLDSPYPRTYLQLGHVLVAMEKASDAIPYLQTALKIEPQSSGLVWVDLARAYRLLDQPEKSVAAFEQAIKHGQRDASVYYQLAMVAKKAGNLERSREALAISQRLRNENDQKKP